MKEIKEESGSHPLDLSRGVDPSPRPTVRIGDTARIVAPDDADLHGKRVRVTSVDSFRQLCHVKFIDPKELHDTEVIVRISRLVPEIVPMPVHEQIVTLAARSLNVDPTSLWIELRFTKPYATSGDWHARIQSPKGTHAGAFGESPTDAMVNILTGLHSATKQKG